MKKILIALAASVAVASPALANEGRIEARGGIIWDSGATEDVYGVAAGYDFDLGGNTFAGVEVSGDKVGATGSGLVIGFTGRLGVKAGTGTRLVADAGYSAVTCAACDDPIHAGVSIEQDLGTNVYGRVGYRHYFYDAATDVDAVAVGVGVRF